MGLTPFNSYLEWAEVVGGVMMVNGLGDPCLPQKEYELVPSDDKTRAMQELFDVSFHAFPQETTKPEIFDLIATLWPQPLLTFEVIFKKAEEQLA